MIPFNVPPYIGKEDKYIKQAIDSRKICGDGQFTKKCNVKFEEMTGAKKALMTTSGTSELEMAALPVRWTPYAISPKDTTLLLLKMPHRVLWAFIKEEHSVRSEILAVTVFMKQRITAWARVELSS